MLGHRVEFLDGREVTGVEQDDFRVSDVALEGLGALRKEEDHKYLIIIDHGTVAACGHTNLTALNAAGKAVTDEHKPLRGRPTTKCIGRYDSCRSPVPGLHKTQLSWICRLYVRTIAK